MNIPSRHHGCFNPYGPMDPWPLSEKVLKPPNHSKLYPKHFLSEATTGSIGNTKSWSSMTTGWWLGVATTGQNGYTSKERRSIHIFSWCEREKRNSMKTSGNGRNQSKSSWWLLSFGSVACTTQIETMHCTNGLVRDLRIFHWIMLQGPECASDWRWLTTLHYSGAAKLNAQMFKVHGCCLPSPRTIFRWLHAQTSSYDTEAPCTQFSSIRICLKRKYSKTQWLIIIVPIEITILGVYPTFRPRSVNSKQPWLTNCITTEVGSTPKKYLQVGYSHDNTCKWLYIYIHIYIYNILKSP